MSDNFKYAQLQPFALAGSGISIGAVSITLTSFLSIDGVALTMSDFGTIGYGTLEPNSFQREEQISFTGITQNLNGTATLTGVKTVGFLYPYTQVAGVTKSHPGGATFVITNTSGFYNTFTNKDDDETVVGAWVFPNVEPTRPQLAIDTDATIATSLITYGQLARAVFGAVPSASTTVNGTVELATSAEVAAGTAVGGTGAFLVPANSSFNITPAASVVPVGLSTALIDQRWVDQIFVAGEAIDTTAAGANKPLVVYMKESDGRVYLMQGNQFTEQSWNFLGFAVFNQNVAIGGNIKVRIYGVVPNFAGLTTGDYQWVDTVTPGFLTNSQITGIRVGKAKSATEVLIDVGRKFYKVSQVFNATATVTFTVGFRTQYLLISAINAAGQFSTGSWMATSGNDCVYTGGAGAFGVLNTKAWTTTDGAGNLHDGVINTVTNSSFNIVNTKTGAAANVTLLIEIFGN